MYTQFCFQYLSCTLYQIKCKNVCMLKIIVGEYMYSLYGELFHLLYECILVILVK